eukprot:s936_g8.t1
MQVWFRRKVHPEPMLRCNATGCNLERPCLNGMIWCCMAERRQNSLKAQRTPRLAMGTGGMTPIVLSKCLLNF